MYLDVKFQMIGLLLADEDYLERLMVSSCKLFGGCRDRFLMRTPYCTLDKQRFELSMTDAAHCFCLLRLTLRLYASLPRICDWLFSLMSASCLGLRPPAAMTDG